jgi:fluoride exporter
MLAGGVTVDYLWIGVGAAVGANGRYLIGQAAANWIGSDFPYGTLIINVSGSLLIGLGMVLLSEHMLVDTHWRLLLIVGLLGGYTTFSSYSYETIALLQQGRWFPAVAYALLSVVMSLVACYGGVVLARAMER